MMKKKTRTTAAATGAIIGIVSSFSTVIIRTEMITAEPAPSPSAGTLSGDPMAARFP